MKERPILFSGPMVKAIIEGRKAQTRRLNGLEKINRNPDSHAVAHPDGGGNWVFWYPDSPGLAEKTKQLYPNGEGVPCPYGRPGDRLWVRETWAPCNEVDNGPHGKLGYTYRADWDTEDDALRDHKWKPAIFMPRWASRLTLEIVGVRVERLQAVTESDAQAEGVTPSIVGQDLDGLKFRAGFQSLWDQINGRRVPWELNPWVWVIEFKRAEAQ